jgi:metal-responsive CopG/Arc/MetJ family transcriptional regulator
MKRTTLFLPEHYVEKLDAFCRATGLTFSEVIRRAVDDYLQREVPKVMATAQTIIKKRRTK